MAGHLTKERRDLIDTPVIDYLRMADRWDLLHDLLGGTFTMRAAAEKWLPKEEEESTKGYEVRRERSFLFNAYKNSIRRVVSKPFAKPVVVTGKLSERLAMIEKDVDRLGTDLTQLSRNMFEAGITYGLTHVLVDFSRMAPGATLADEQESEARPTFVHVKPPDLIGWRSEIDFVKGGRKLTQIRILEHSVEPEGMFIDKEVTRIRVFSEVDWQLWRSIVLDTGKKIFMLEDGGPHSFGAVPLATFYVERTGLLTADPPLEDLAEMNLMHWQSSSDQRNYLRFIRMGLLLATGFDKKEIDKGITIGVNRMLSSGNPDADLKYVEHEGKASEAGRTDLQDTEEQMEVLGAQPLIQRSVRTATQRMIDESRVDTDAQAWVGGLENTLVEMYRMAGRWIGEELPNDFKTDVNNDFGISQKKIEDTKNLIEMRKLGEISRETFLTEIRKLGTLSEGVDIEEEMARIQDEGSTLITMTADEEGEE